MILNYYYYYFINISFKKTNNFSFCFVDFLKEINLDNDEELQEIKQQLSEIKISTSKKAGLGNNNYNYNSKIINSSSACNNSNSNSDSGNNSATNNNNDKHIIASSLAAINNNVKLNVKHDVKPGKG